MRRFTSVIVAAVLLTGCGVEVLTTTAIQGELQKEQLQAVKRQTAHAGDTMAKSRIESAIQAYRAEKGVNPPSLDALVPDYLPAVPLQSNGQSFGYDPAAGRLIEGAASVSAGAVQADADAENLRRLETAIAAYGRDTGYYPPMLSALVPLYLDKLPTTASGQDYSYEPQTGRVSRPGAAVGTPPVQRPAQGMNLSGAGPAGEAAAAIGIQSELNSMSQSGASAAGNRARSSVAGTSGNYQQGQDQALKELGY